MKLPDFKLDFDVQAATILLVASGSHAYGTATPTSDRDFKGIFIPPMDYYLSPFRSIDMVGWKVKDGVTHIGKHVTDISGAEEEG